MTHQSFAHADFGDKRINKRFEILCEAFNQKPLASIAKVFPNFHQSKAAYRFFDNPLVSKQKILTAHHNTLQTMLKESSIILEIQDTTELDFTNQLKTEGKGRLGSKKSCKSGFLCHHSLLVSGEGIPIGIGSLEVMCRKHLKPSKRNARQIPLKDKESFKWIQAIENVDKTGFEDRIIITDREGDFYELFDHICERDQNMIIRTRFDRKNIEGNWIKEIVCGEAIVGTTQLPIRAKGGKYPREAHTADIEVRFSTQTILPPKNLYKQYVHHPSLTLTIIHVTEAVARADEDPIEWFLLTTLPVVNQKDVLQIIKWYSFRWLIEEFHKILKAGIKVEDCRLKTGTRLENLIAILSPIACRLLFMTYFHRIQPQALVSSILTPIEVKYLAFKFGQKNEELTVKQAIHLIAKFGGFLGRKSDKDPGLLTLWTGWLIFCEKIEAVKDFECFF